MALLSMLYCHSLIQHIFRAFSNDFESHYRMFTYIFFSEAKHCYNSHSMTSKVKSSHSLSFVGRGHRKFTKIATIITFSQW